MVKRNKNFVFLPGLRYTIPVQAVYRQSDAGDRTEEADKVSARIAAILSERAFSFTPNEYLSIHRRLFTGVYSHAGHSGLRFF